MKLKSNYISLTSENRLYQTDIPIIGLTGGIATGKSQVSKLLANLPIIDADKNVKEIYATNESKEFILKHFPQAIVKQDIDFKILRSIVFSDEKAKNHIENYIYSKLPAVFNSHLNKLGNIDFVIYDVPLLFEKGLDKLIDVSVVVYAPENIQKQRLIQRDQISEELAQKIINSQLNIEIKKKKANFVIDNSATLEDLAKNVDQFKNTIFN